MSNLQLWIAVFGTALGAIIGLGSAFINERVKWERDQEQDRLGFRRDLYAEYIAGLTETHESMRAISRNEKLRSVDLSAAINESFHASGPYSLRYQIALIADQEVLDAAEAAFKQIRDIRDTLAAGVGTKDES